jgi:hypothetical protein
VAASAKCHHPSFEVDASPMADEKDPDVVFLTLRARCPVCGSKFRFRGVSSDYDPAAPTVNRRGTQICLPLEREVALS